MLLSSNDVQFQCATTWLDHSFSVFVFVFHWFLMLNAMHSIAVQHPWHIVFAYPFHFGISRFSAYFFMPNLDIRILSRFFMQVHIDPYILFSSCKWHQWCRPSDESKNAKWLRDGVMCFILQIHTRWMMKTLEEPRVKGVTQEVRLRGLNRRTRDRSHYERTYRSIAFVDDLSLS